MPHQQAKLTLSNAGATFWGCVEVTGSAKNLTRPQQSELRAQLIQAVVDLTPMMMIANIACFFIVDLLFWSPEYRLFLTIWTGAMLLAGLWWMVSHHRSQKHQPRQKASARGVQRMTMHAAFMGLIWSAPIVFLFPNVAEAHRVVLVAVASGAAAAGALTLALVWQAALVYAIALLAPVLAMLMTRGEATYMGLAGLGAFYGYAIVRTVAERGRLFADNFIKRAHLREQSQVIGLLLKDFEESSSDWLFEIDAEGRIANVSSRHAIQLGVAVEDIVGRGVIDSMRQFWRRPDHSTEPSLRRLQRAFKLREPFRDVVVPLTIDSEDRWWSLTGKPMYDAAGTFLGYRGVGSDITTAKRAEASIEYLASYDALTGLPNRNLFQMRLKRAANHLRQQGEVFAVLSLDLDRFKNVNDALGHKMGDSLLVEAARRIRAALAPDDMAARFGGDEFVILKAGVDGSFAAAQLAERLIADLTAPYDIDGHRILVGASIGIAVASDVMSSFEDLLRNSELALYRAKAAGKGRHCFYADEMDAAIQTRRLLEIDLREALDKSRLDVFFQPLIEVATGRVSGCEALVRWKHPTRGYVPPAEFIPLAEETGLIIRLGEFVLRAACREAAGWARDICVAVNLSAIQFHTGDLVELVKDVLAETGLAPNRLELEVTESILIEDRETVSATLSALRDIGVRIALDDFGTGYSSLAYLSSFPFDKIKIDRSFVRDVATRDDAGAIVRAIMSLAGSLGMRTTAEGVEYVAELEWLREHGCDEAQGFLFSAPAPARDLRYLIGQGFAETQYPERLAS
jgi:diguanylate cyclase (GGDEF)-like protein/PAS domain S-box-containing protein